ncbi:hypothetical protein NDU88_007043 [Pleurodeles waltl]|uniref:Uncharacterized protein n=1 Tax=Pleurodeles waltl TaxID=8319 RepID=A0AAV7UPX4_PLEWA|nr:hypothetical protein NDU88_007043 [Pleurodeles waltl]
MPGTVAADSCLPPGAQALPLSSTGAPATSGAHLRPTEHQRHGALLGRRCTTLQGLKATRLKGRCTGRARLLQASAQARSSALPFGSSAGVPGPPGLLTLRGVRCALSVTRLHPIWGRKAVSEALAAEHGQNTSAHTAILATPPCITL